MKLLDKIEHEYYVFKMGYLIASRENIFIHAEEIATKKAIYKHLKKSFRKYEADEQMTERLLAIDNILDNIYSYVQEHNQVRFSKEFEMWLKNSV